MFLKAKLDQRNTTQFDFINTQDNTNVEYQSTLDIPMMNYTTDYSKPLNHILAQDRFEMPKTPLMI